ncbi:MAG: TonB-dependent receptor [Rhodocyclaceae bacterium]|nr:TonB-dependent receptor [Rhodocyclaceae bacterium]
MRTKLSRLVPAMCWGLLAAASAGAAAETTLGTITVTATLDDVAERRESTAQKVIVSRQDIEAMGALTIGDVMGKLPGVDAGAQGADGSMALRSRGMVRDSVQIMVDGERVHHNARVAQGIVGRLPATELLRVEITRGSSAEVGGSAPLTVNLVLAKPLSRESTAFKAAVGYREGRAIAQTNITKGGGDKNFSWLLPVTLNHHEMPSARQASRRDSTGLWQEDSEQGQRRTEEFVVSPRLTWKSGRDSLSLNPVFFRSSGPGDSDFARIDLNIPANSATRHDQTRSRNAFNRLRADGEMFRPGVKYSGRLNFSDGERRTDTLRSGLTGGGSATLTEEETRRKERDLGGAFRTDWSSGAHVLAAAVEYTGHRRDEYQSNSSLGSSETHDGWDRQWSVWLQDEWSLAAATTVTLGLRGESLRYAIDGVGQRHQEFLPSVAIKWQPVEQWVFRSSLGAGIKPPRLDELTNQPIFSVNANTPLEPDRRGNPNLRPERSLNFEAVLERYLPGEAGVLGANLYLRHTQDFIERRVQLEGARWVDRPDNEGAARHWGMELDAKLRTDSLGWRGATFRTHLTVPRSRVDDARLGMRRDAREQPRYILSGGYDQTLGARSFGLSFQHSGRVRTAVPGEQAYETRQRTVVDAYALQKLNRELNLRLSLQNLLRADTRRQMEAFAPGSSWYLRTEERSARTVLLSLEGKW